MALRRIDQAERLFLEVLAADPDNPDAPLGLGRIYLKSAFYTLARVHFDQPWRGCRSRPHHLQNYQDTHNRLRGGDRLSLYPGLPILSLQRDLHLPGRSFSLGSSSAIANLIAGISLTYTRSFQEGDVIKVGESMGVVLERKLNVTRKKTYKNQVITIPNGVILTSHVTNLSHEVRYGDGLILHTSITIGYDAPWETVHALLIEAANVTKHLLKRPPPFVLQTGLNDFYVTYELNAYTDAPEIMPRLYGELHQNIQNKFNEAGVEIMSPHYTPIRDGNHSTIPADYVPPAIRIVTGPDKTVKK